MNQAVHHVVLLVEDDADVRESIAEILADNDYEPMIATNGKDALSKLRSRAEKPCVILLDIMMPVMDGRHFRTLQMSDPELRSIPVVVLSAHADVADTAKAMSASSYIRKPLDLDELLRIIRTVCAHHEPGQ